MTYKAVGGCSANVERSAIFDAALNYEKRDRGIGDELEISSAGLLVEKIHANKSPLHVQVRILGAGLKYGLVRPGIQDAVQQVVDAGTDQEHTNQVRALYGEVRPIVHGFLKACRDKALEDAGVDLSPSIYNHLDPNDGFDVVIPMVAKDTAKVESKYASSDVDLPTVVSYGELVGTGDVVDDVQSAWDGAKRKVEFFMDTRGKALDAILELQG